MQKRTTFTLILILCAFFIEGCGLVDPCYYKSNSSGFQLDAKTNIPKRIGLVRFKTYDPTDDVVNDEFSNYLKKLGFDVVETNEYREAKDCVFCEGHKRVKMEKIRDLSNFYSSDYYYKEFRDMIKEKFHVEAIFVWTCYGSGYTCVDLIDIKTGRIIWTGASDTSVFTFKNVCIHTPRKLLRRLESDIESHNEALKSKAK